MTTLTKEKEWAASVFDPTYGSFLSTNNVHRKLLAQLYHREVLHLAQQGESEAVNQPRNSAWSGITAAIASFGESFFEAVELSDEDKQILQSVHDSEPIHSLRQKSSWLERQKNFSF